MKTSIVGIVRDSLEYPDDTHIKQQFRELIDKLLQKNEGLFSTGYLDVVIDALDKCTMDSREWVNFLEILESWACLPCAFKLIVTSCNHHDIRDTLLGTSQSHSLNTMMGKVIPIIENLC
jgi:hypothetical protein